MIMKKRLGFINKTVDVGIFAMPIIAILFLAITNSVNLTDGLDGLAGGISAIYFLTIGIISILLGNTKCLIM